MLYKPNLNLWQHEKIFGYFWNVLVGRAKQVYTRVQVDVSKSRELTWFCLQRRLGVVERSGVATLASVRRAAVGGRGASADAADDVRRAGPTSKV